MELMMLGDTIDHIYILHFLQNVKSVVVTLPMSEIEGTLQNVSNIFCEYNQNRFEIIVIRGLYIMNVYLENVSGTLFIFVSTCLENNVL